MAGTCQPWWYRESNGNTYPLRAQSGRTCQAWSCCSWNIKKSEYVLAESPNWQDMSGMIVLLMKYKYAHLVIENGRNMSAMMVLRIIWEYVPAESPKWQDMSDMIVLHMKYKYALPDKGRWREHVSRDNGLPHGMGLHTRWESKVAGTRQPWLCCSWSIYTHFLIIENGGNMSAVIIVQLME